MIKQIFHRLQSSYGMVWWHINHFNQCSIPASIHSSSKRPSMMKLPHLLSDALLSSAVFQLKSCECSRQMVNHLFIREASVCSPAGLSSSFCFAIACPIIQLSDQPMPFLDDKGFNNTHYHAVTTWSCCSVRKISSSGPPKN